MPIFTEQEFQTHLRQKQPLPLYLIYGAETYMVRWYARQTERMVLEDASNDLNYTVFSFDELDRSMLFNELDSLPPFCSRRCVRIADVQADGMKKEQLDKWKPIFQAPSETATLLLVCADRELDYKRSTGWKGFASGVDKAGGGVLCCERKTTVQLRKFVIDRCAKQGATLPPTLADRLLSNGITDLLTLAKEADKLSAWCGQGGTITPDALETLSPVRPDATVYQMAGDLSRGNRQALNRLHQLLEGGTEPNYLMATLGGAFTDLYRSRCALDAGKSAQALTEDFHYSPNRAFVTRNAMRDCQNFSAVFLRRAVWECYTCEGRMKSTGLENRLLLQELTVKLLALAGKI